MKRMMMAGGLFGFGMGIASGYYQGSSATEMLWRASVAACLAGLLLRWLGRIWWRNLMQAYYEQNETSTQANPNPPSPANPINS